MSWVCLMYHDVTPGPKPLNGGPDRFTVSRESFERVLQAIEEAGCVGCSLAECLTLHGRRRVAITFDDGTIGQFDQAAPALLARDMTATFFVTTNWIGTEGYMGWEQLRRLTEWGMSVQSHTKSHPLLSELDRGQLRAELSESKAVLDRELGQTTTQIALPSGNAPRARLRDELADCGYEVVATSRWGSNAEGDGTRRPRWVRRCTAPRSPDPELARRIVTGDPRLAAVRYSREAALNGVRALVGPSRYARWRRKVLDAFAHD